MTMPPTTVSSVVVKEEDWAPDAFGDCSGGGAGAVVSTELGGVGQQKSHSRMARPRKGRLAHAARHFCQEAQLHSREADLALARADVDARRDLAPTRKSNFKADSDSAGIEIQPLERGRRSKCARTSEETACRAVRRAARNSPGERRPTIERAPYQCSTTRFDPVFVDFFVAPKQYLSQLSTDST